VDNNLSGFNNSTMPKVQNEGVKLRQFVEEFSSDVFKTDGKIRVLYCIICDQSVPITKRSNRRSFVFENLKQHIT